MPDDPTPSLEDTIARKTARALDATALDSIFRAARSANGFSGGSVSRELVERAVTLAELGPTSSNSLPVRYLFVESPEAKALLKPALSGGNVAKTMQAPLTAIVAADLFFYERFAQTQPSRTGMTDKFGGPGNVEFVRTFARDNALLQMGYFIIAARAVGLDCGPMGGFDKKAVDEAFFADGRWISLYLINLGYDDGVRTFPRLPRLGFDDIARFA